MVVDCGCGLVVINRRNFVYQLFCVSGMTPYWRLFYIWCIVLYRKLKYIVSVMVVEIVVKIKLPLTWNFGYHDLRWLHVFNL